MTQTLRRRLVSLWVFALSLFVSAPAMAVPVWSRIDTGLGAAVAPNGQIAQANAVGDSVWIRVLNPDGAIRWTAHWDLKTTRNLWLKALVPTADAGWIVAMDTADGMGSWMVRLDSLGRQVGSPMGMRHDTCLSLFVVEGPAGATWVAPRTRNERASTLFRFDSLGRFKDSTPLPSNGALQGIRVLSGKLVVWHNRSADLVHNFLLYGPRAQSAKDSLVFLDQDTLIRASYSSLLHSGRDSTGDDRLMFATDSGILHLIGGIVPRVRMVSWIVRGDSLERQFDATNELALPEAFWIGADGKVKVVGARRTAASVGGVVRFEPAVVQLDDKFRQVRAWAVHPDGSPTAEMGYVFAGSFPDGSGFVGLIGSGKPNTITMLDRAGDSIHNLSLATTYLTNRWFGQPNGQLVGLGQSRDGSIQSIESWSTAANTSVRGRSPTFSSLCAVGTRLVLDLEHPVATAWLDMVDLQGRIRETRSIGPLSPGRHEWEVTPRGATLVHLRIDDQTLVAKVPMRVR